MLEVGMFLADRYEIIGKIGTGGMSDVYKAKDQILSRYVAVKVLKTEFSEDAGFVTKFKAEAQSAAGLEHPNIVNIYDVGSEAGVYYIVMEYVEGITLKTYIEKKGQLSFKESASIAIQVARGIEVAHSKNIIHRDIKPQNIIISTEGKVKVTDFGIARAASSNTISADVMGSVHYASPEQARNGFVDGRSDIYSLGIVMFEMITGRVPFDGDTTVAVALQHLQEDIAKPSEYAPNCPISFEKIILKCTQKTPDRRYQTISELLADLRKSLSNPNEDFVVIAPLVDNSKTKVITADEVEALKERGIEEDDIDSEVEGLEEGQEGEEEEEETGILNPKMDKAVTIMGIVTAVIILIVIIYLILSFAGILKFGSKKKDTQKPETETTQVETQTEEEFAMVNIVGKSYDEAEAELEKLGLTIFAFECDPSSDEEDGTILKQEIAVGEMVKKGDQINVVIAGSTTEVSEVKDVPNVVGKSKSAAESALKKAGFKNYTFEYVESSDSEKDYVISQDTTGKKSVNTKIVIQVGQGQQAVSVPNVVGKSEADAKSEISNAGLTYNVNYESSDSVASGNVISQDLSSGKKVAKGTCVTITVSKGQAQVDIPNVIGDSKSVAKSKLEAAGFSVTIEEVYNSDTAEGIVFKQSATGTATKGKTITITVSKGPEPTPDTPDSGNGGEQTQSQ